MPDQEKTPMQQLIESVGDAQASNQAVEYILLEIVHDIARTQPHPDRYLSDLFEKVSARADQGPIEHEAHPVTGEFRKIVATFFATLRRTVP